MPTQDPLESPARRVIDRIVEERFTGVLRVSSHEASGELWFLAGILEDARFGVSKGDEALERLLRATQVVFQAELRLPHFNGGFKKPMPQAGTFAEAHPVVLMRYCESYALTCSLELKGKERTVRIAYRTGELLSADAASAGNEVLAAMLESDEGSWEIVLPTFELPPGVNAAPAATSVPKLSLAERIDQSLSEQSAEEAKALAELKAKTQRKADEAAAEAKRKADEASAALAKRKADEAAAEAKRKADEAAAEAKRKADEASAALAKRKADEASAALTKRKADEAAAEAKRKADEASAAVAKREAEEAAAQAKREAEEAAAQAKREAEEAAAVIAQREGNDVLSTAEREASANDPGSEESRTESEQEGSEQPATVARKGGFPWFWLFLALLLVGLAYFTRERFGLR